MDAGDGLALATARTGRDAGRLRGPSPGRGAATACAGDLHPPDFLLSRASSRHLGHALLAYLQPDLVPDFIPIAGQLDDAIVVALVLRSVLRSGGPELLREHWRGPQRSLDVLLRLA